MIGNGMSINCIKGIITIFFTFLFCFCPPGNRWISSVFSGQPTVRPGRNHLIV